jgi:hypothetical protein
MKIRICALGTATLTMLALFTSPAMAASPAGPALKHLGVQQTLLAPVHWRKRAPAYPHYPRDYWWYYRPYDYGRYNYYPRGRSLTYFHYLYEPAPPRGRRTRDADPGYK